MTISRFAPSITGRAHPGTLLAALLAWLDARAGGRRILLRLEDLDRTRLRPGYHQSMLDALEWFGLDWDEVGWQSEMGHRHEAALDRLQRDGRLYPCDCDRAARRAGGRRSPAGGYAYENRCRDLSLPPGGWRAAKTAVRLRLPDRRVALADESGLDLSQTPAKDVGDPIVIRRDGVVAYHLAVVVDDACGAVGRIVRGRDLAASTATQVLIQELLGVPPPTYRHHFLLLEKSAEKLSKFHGALGYPELCDRGDGTDWCSRLATLAGLLPAGERATPRELVPRFRWLHVRADDVLCEI